MSPHRSPIIIPCFSHCLVGLHFQGLQSPVGSTLPNRATPKIRSARSAQKRRKNGTSREMSAHQCVRFRCRWSRAKSARNRNSATYTAQRTQLTTERITSPGGSVISSCARTTSTKMILKKPSGRSSRLCEGSASMTLRWPSATGHALPRRYASRNLISS